MRSFGCRARADGGFTLVELLVSVAILAIVGPLIAGLLVTLQKQTQIAVNAQAAAAGARLAMSTLNFQVRSGAADPTLLGSPYIKNAGPSGAPTNSSLGYWTSFSATGTPLPVASGRCVQFRIDPGAGTLAMRTFPASGSARGTWAVVAHGLGSGSYFLVAARQVGDKSAQVSVRLRAQITTGTSTGPITSVDSTIALRNPVPTGVDTTPCKDFT